MAFREFDVGPIGGLRFASARELPNLVIVAGPNGSGKSTLLHTLYTERVARAETGTRVSYLGPHRGWRKTQLGTASLSEFAPGLRSYLELDAVPNWRHFRPHGLDYIAAGQARDPGGLDESFSFVKAAITRLELRQQRVVRETWERQQQQLSPGDVPDLLAPLRQLVRSLLPHLDVQLVDVTDDANVRVLFRRIDGQADALVEVDELSSGEKAVVGLMLPFVEDEADRLTGAASAETATPTMIIDEPETHLHPTLQVLLLDYLSQLASEGTGQFILATQSPTILDASDNFFLLAPAAAVPDGNQLIHVSDEFGRLEAMRALTGSTHLLTRCRPIVLIEGERPASRSVSDQRLIELLVPAATGWVLVAAGGRTQVARTAQQLRAAMAEGMPGVPVFAIVDSDQGEQEDADYVIGWPVAMIENLLLDPAAIWSVLCPHRERLDLGSEQDVDAELRRLADDRRPDEVRLRVSALQRPVSVRIRPDKAADMADAIEGARNAANAQFDEFARDSALLEQFRAAEARVEAIASQGRELELFRGKELFRGFFDAQAKHCGYSYPAFAFAVAQAVRGTPRLRELTTEAVRRIEQYVPADGLAAVQSASALLAGTVDEMLAAEALDAGTAARAAWDDGDAPALQPEPLRDLWLGVARAIEDQDPLLARRLRGCAAELGLRSTDPSGTS